MLCVHTSAVRVVGALSFPFLSSKRDFFVYTIELIHVHDLVGFDLRAWAKKF
jgi:hypothetical protein